MKSIISENCMTLSLEQCRDGISLEAGVIDNIMQTVTKYLPNLSSGFSEKVNKFKSDTNGPVIETSKDYKQSVELLKSVSFLSLEQIPVFVHEGFNAKLLDFVPVMNATIDSMSSVVELVADYRTFLGSVITNSDKRLSLDNAMVKYAKKKKDMDSLSTTIDKFYKANSYKTKVYFPEVFDRNSDVEAFFKAMDTIKNRLNTIPLGKIRSDVDVCVELLDLFISRVESGDITNISPDVIKNLSNMAYLIALEVEFFAANYYRLNIFITTSNNLNELLKKLNIN